jgi:hypothetical protein
VVEEAIGPLKGVSVLEQQEQQQQKEEEKEDRLRLLKLQLVGRSRGARRGSVETGVDSDTSVTT